MNDLVAITRPDFPGPGIGRLAGLPTRTWSERRSPSADELAALCTGATALLCTGADRIDDRLLERCPRLKVVAVVGAGFENLDLAALGRHGVPASNTPSVLHRSVADLTLALVLAAARFTHTAEQYLRSGQWRRAEWDLFLGTELYGRTMGIVGYGEIGHEVAVRAAGFGMPIIYVSRSTKVAAIGRRVDLDDLLESADVVSLHVPQTADTVGMIGAPQLRRMKPTAFLVNTARGAIVDQGALVAALQDGVIAGAALDVMDGEPIDPTDPLLRAPNVVLTPHYGSATRQARHAMVERAVDNVLAGLRGDRLPSCVNPEVYL